MLTHDFSNCYWGHDCSVLSVEGETIRVVGWCLGIKEGHYLILKNGESTTRYQVTEIKYKWNVPDMFEATAVFSPRNHQ